MPPTAASLARGLFVNGVFNNLGYVVMLSAAKSILPQASVAYVLLFDDTPALLAQVRVDGRGVTRQAGIFGFRAFFGCTRVNVPFAASSPAPRTHSLSGGAPRCDRASPVFSPCALSEKEDETVRDVWHPIAGAESISHM